MEPPSRDRSTPKHEYALSYQGVLPCLLCKRSRGQEQDTLQLPGVWVVESSQHCCADEGLLDSWGPKLSKLSRRLLGGFRCGAMVDHGGLEGG